MQLLVGKSGFLGPKDHRAYLERTMANGDGHYAWDTWYSHYQITEYTGLVDEYGEQYYIHIILPCPRCSTMGLNVGHFNVECPRLKKKCLFGDDNG